MLQRPLVDIIIINRLRFFLWLPTKAETEDKVELLQSAALFVLCQCFRNRSHQRTSYNGMFPWMKVIESDTDFIILHIHRQQLSLHKTKNYSHWLWWLWQSLGRKEKTSLGLSLLSLCLNCWGTASSRANCCAQWNGSDNKWKYIVHILDKSWSNL